MSAQLFDAHESLGWEIDRRGHDGPNPDKSRIGVLNAKLNQCKQSDHVDYEMTDGKARPIPKNVTHFWIGVFLPLAVEPNVRNASVIDRHLTTADKDRAA